MIKIKLTLYASEALGEIEYIRLERQYFFWGFCFLKRNHYMINFKGNDYREALVLT